MRAFLLSPLLLLAACGGDEPEEVPIEEQIEAEAPEIIDGEDVTAIDAATDRDAGLVDEEVPGRDAAND
ncbi:hypothetical protein [Sphingomicrobium sediminis]|uniref:Uncharacterized protein n=1 Tax=Sphingomicrobium sediminis TaxID=2950949 RepID=A0A9X2EFQ2_9SPHN|nr:hypothetical protein [Sphingomicrobium sediminis]MCM8557145.1 hypothetical protein [Sphingomicrobium sediminis]